MARRVRDYSACIATMQNPSEVRLAVCRKTEQYDQTDIWIKFSGHGYGLQEVSVLVDNPAVLFQLRYVVEQAIQTWLNLPEDD